MDKQTLFNVLTSVVLAVVGWVGREVWGALKMLRKDLQKLEVNIPTNYVSKSDFTKTMDHIEDMFQRIYDKLDGKADK
jgi:hypothetical protein